MVIYCCILILAYKYTTFFLFVGVVVKAFLFWIWDGLLVRKENAGRHNIIGVGTLFEG